MDELFDPDTGLFSGSDPSADGPFDPFLPRFREEGETSTDQHGDADGDDGEGGSATLYDYTERFGRYGPSGGESDSGFSPDDDRSLPWQGAGDQPILGAEERRAREGADTGNRNVRRAAEKHGGRSQSGGSGSPASNESRVDSSIAAASQRIKDELRVPLDPRQRSDAIVKWETAGDKNRKLTRHYEKQGISSVPQFGNTTFEAMLAGLKANVNGEWILTLKIDPNAAHLIFPLHSAFGLALDVQINRHRHRTNDNDVHT